MTRLRGALATVGAALVAALALCMLAAIVWWWVVFLVES